MTVSWRRIARARGTAELTLAFGHLSYPAEQPLQHKTMRVNSRSEIVESAYVLQAGLLAVDRPGPGEACRRESMAT